MSKNVAKEIDFNELGLYLCNKKEKNKFNFNTI